MKEILMFLFLFLVGNPSSAQEIKKELQTEEDGYKWYRTSQNFIYGAESMDGKTIIPLSKKYDFVVYKAPYHIGMYHSDKPGIIYKNEYYTKVGKEILDNSKYDDTYLRGGENGIPLWFKIKKDEKEGACDINGNEIIPPIFSSCFYFDGELTVQDNKGYHKWSEYKNASSQTTSIEELFALAYNTPDTEAQTKYNRYIQVIQADPYNSYGYKASAYNNIGVLYENLGDLKNAKTCYEYALQANPNNNNAKENLKT